MAELTSFEVKEKVKDYLLGIPGVSGVGLMPGSTERINIYVIEKTAEILGKLPKTINGIETRIIETGQISALPISGYGFMGEEYPALETSRTAKMRPAQPGISIGQVNVSAGTLGAIVRDNATGRKAILSNAHVLTASPIDNFMENPTVVQPGIYDGATLADRIGATKRWIQLSTESSNIVDCAFALPDSDADINDEILEIGKVQGVGTAAVGMEVLKSGRSSGITEGSVIDVNADMKVTYKNFSATFTDQVVTSAMAIPGDSGSLTLWQEKHYAVGLLFAGSDKVTIHNKIHNVLNALNISMVGYTPPPPPARASSLVLLPLALGGAYMWWKGRK